MNEEEFLQRREDNLWLAKRILSKYSERDIYDAERMIKDLVKLKRLLRDLDEL